MRLWHLGNVKDAEALLFSGTANMGSSMGARIIPVAIILTHTEQIVQLLLDISE